MTDQTSPSSLKKSTTPKRAWLERAMALLLTTGLFVWFIRGDHWQGLYARVCTMSLHQVALAAAAFALTYLLRAGRVFDEFKHSSPLKIPFLGILRITLIHNAMVNILPFRSGEAAFPMLLSRWFQVPTARAVATLLWLRIQDAFVVLALAAWLWPDLSLGLRLLWVTGVFIGAWGIPVWARTHTEILDTHGKFRRTALKLQAALAESTQSNIRGWLWTVANWSVKLAAQAWLLATLLNTALLTGLAGAMGAELAAILPIQGVAGFGTYEAGSAALLAPHSISMNNGLQAALALHLFVIACSLISGVLAMIFLPATKKE